MKASNDSTYVIASLSSNCERLSMGSSWEDFLTQNGLRFRLTGGFDKCRKDIVGIDIDHPLLVSANCSSALVDHTAQANNTGGVTNEIPRNTHRSSRLHNTNSSDIAFNEIVADKITSGTRKRQAFVLLNLLGLFY